MNGMDRRKWAQISRDGDILPHLPVDKRLGPEHSLIQKIPLEETKKAPRRCFLQSI